jgi:hypothetical protein
MRSGHRSGHSAGPILIRRKNLVSSLHFFREGGFYRRAEGVPALRGSGRTRACVPGVDTPGCSNPALAGRIYVGSDLMTTRADKQDVCKRLGGSPGNKRSQSFKSPAGAADFFRRMSPGFCRPWRGFLGFYVLFPGLPPWAMGMPPYGLALGDFGHRLFRHPLKGRVAPAELRDLLWGDEDLGRHWEKSWHQVARTDEDGCKPLPGTCPATRSAWHLT